MNEHLFSRKTLLFLIIFIAVYSIKTEAIVVTDCGKRLAQIIVNPLRPKGTEVQEHYFRVIDQVAKDFANTPQFISPVAWRKRTASEGLPALDLPTEVGGKNLPPSDMIKIFEYAGRYSLNLRDISGGAHGRVLLYSENPQHKEILKQIAKGEGYMAIAITEREAGSDVRNMKTVAKKVDGGYEISGEKRYNARFDTASHIILITQAPEQAGKKGKLNVFVIPKDYSGLKFTHLETPVLKGNSFGGVVFDKLFIPESFRIGEDGDGGNIFRNHFTYWRLMQAATALGTAKKALEMTADRMRSREAFGGKIGRFTHLQQDLSEHTGNLEILTAYLEKTAKTIEEGNYEEASRLAALAKSKCVDAAHAAVDFAVRSHGAAGTSNELDLMERLTDLMGLRIADGTSDVLKSEYLRKTYGNDFWEMAFGE